MTKMDKNAENALTTQQKKFLTEYAESLDIKKAAKSAGYKSTNCKTQGENLLLKERYRRELERIISQKATYLDVCKAYIIKKYLELLEYASETDSGTPKDPTLALRALDGLCKHLPEGQINSEDSSLGVKIDGLNVNKI